MKVQLLKNMIIETEIKNATEVIELEDTLAESLIKMGKAIQVTGETVVLQSQAKMEPVINEKEPVIDNDLLHSTPAEPAEDLTGGDVELPQKPEAKKEKKAGGKKK